MEKTEETKKMETDKSSIDKSSRDELLEKVDEVCKIKYENGEITINCKDKEVAVSIREKVEKEGLRIRAKGVRGPEPE